MQRESVDASAARQSGRWSRRPHTHSSPKSWMMRIPAGSTARGGRRPVPLITPTLLRGPGKCQGFAILGDLTPHPLTMCFPRDAVGDRYRREDLVLTPSDGGIPITNGSENSSRSEKEGGTLGLNLKPAQSVALNEAQQAIDNAWTLLRVLH